MKNFFNLLFIFSLLTSNLAAAFTVESMFRNGSNKEIERNTILVDIKIEEINQEEVGEKAKPVFTRFIFNRANENRMDLFQIMYDGDISMANIGKMYKRRSFTRFMRLSNDHSPQKNLFYGMLHSLILNDSTLMNKFLTTADISYRPNNELVNKDKVTLLDEYKKYLQSVKDEPSLKDAIPSPLKPEEDEAKEKVAEVLKQPFYEKQEYLKLVKEKDDFFLQLEMDSVKAKFDNKDHLIKEFTYAKDTNVMRMKFYDYLLLNGTHLAPKSVYFVVNNRTFLMTFTQLRHREYKPKVFQRYMKRYVEAMMERPKKVAEKTMNPDGEVVERPQYSFLF